ncbi:uncharacterized protein LOC117327408 isoform X2 [Pecten maximus]|uniref:uncharacterized protein LOC117327408 isoform X2 n=1 Tax=Pecten maximus TaxID=6579 RepID=UPI0014581E7B|nr:uncharacterized protein LOC117327408 isoform X2 [Pecten maximus]
MLAVEDWRGGNGGQAISMDGSLPPLGNIISVPKESTRTNHDSLSLSLPAVNVSQKVSTGNNTQRSPKGPAQSINKATTQDTPTRVKINYLARDKALSILQQYNSIVADDTSLAVRNLPPVKVSIRAKGTKADRRQSDKAAANKPTAPVFTEGISSISTRQGPSFLVSKESVLRANLPDDVSLAQHNNQFAFNIKQKRRKPVAKDGVGTPQYKQIKMLGFDHLPPIDLGEYMRKQLLQKKGVKKGEGQHSDMSGRSSYGHPPIRRLDRPSVGSSVSATPDTYRSGQKALKTSLKAKVDTRLKRKTPTKVSPTYNGSNYRGDRLNIVSIGQKQSGLQDISSPRRFVPGTYPQYDWRARVHEEYRRLKFVPVDSSLNGVCSLAPIKVGLHHQDLPPLNFTDDVPKRFSSYDGVRRIFRDDVIGERLNPLNYRRNLYNRAMGRTTSANSTSTSTSNSNNVINPPPSFVSSSDEEALPKPAEPIREMQPLKEESPSVVGEQVAGPTPTSKAIDSLKKKKENSPVLTPREIVEKNRVVKPKKQPSVGNVVTLGTDLAPNGSESKGLGVPTGGTGSLSPSGGNGFLSLPIVHLMNEGRPPMNGGCEGKAKQSREEEDSMYSDPSGDSGSQKVTVHTVQLMPDQIPARPNVTSVTPVISVTSDSGVNEPVVFRDSDSDDSFGAYSRKMALASKNVQFVSPLDPGQGVAKRQ